MIRPRPLVLVVALAAVLAVGAGAAWWVRTRPVVQTRIMLTRSAQPPTVVADCPLIRCKTELARPAVLSAVRTVFAGAALLSGYRTVGPDGRVYSEGARLTSGLESISVTARCVTGTGPVPERTTRSALGEVPSTVSVVVGGRAGCSVAVIVSVPAGSVDPAVVARLAHRPDLQIPA